MEKPVIASQTASGAHVGSGHLPLVSMRALENPTVLRRVPSGNRADAGRVCVD